MTFMKTKAIVLMGIKHCGKSTQARLLSSYFEVPCFDTDDLITELTGRSPREIYSQDGKDAFMKAEEDACATLEERVAALSESALPSQKYCAVCATGGGICNNEKALEILKRSGILVFLNAEEETAAYRIIREVQYAPDGSLTNLPAYIAKEKPHSIKEVKLCFHKFYTERQKAYAALADYTVNMRNVSKTENRDAVIQVLAKD